MLSDAGKESLDSYQMEPPPVEVMSMKHVIL